MPLNSHLEWKVIYKPGTLEARGVKNGKQLISKIETTGQPATIILSPDRSTIKADGEDVSVVNVSVLDEKGREVADAGNLIKFELTGSGWIIGVGNGDPSSHEADKCSPGNYQRRLFNGKCQVIVQGGRNAGSLQLNATSENLKAASSVIQLEQCKLRDEL